MPLSLLGSANLVRPGHPLKREITLREKCTSKLGRSSCKVLSMRVAVTSLLMLSLCSGCSLIRVGDPVKHMDLSSEDDAEENLKAVRAMLANQAARSAPGEQLSDPSIRPSEVVPPPNEPTSGTRLLPSPSSSARMPDASAKLPWTPSAPERPAAPDRPVPAYTTPAPVGPDYSGSIRCTPDGMGGQRCAGR